MPVDKIDYIQQPKSVLMDWRGTHVGFKYKLAVRELDKKKVRFLKFYKDRMRKRGASIERRYEAYIQLCEKSDTDLSEVVQLFKELLAREKVFIERYIACIGSRDVEAQAFLHRDHKMVNDEFMTLALSLAKTDYEEVLNEVIESNIFEDTLECDEELDSVREQCNHADVIHESVVRPMRFGNAQDAIAALDNLLDFEFVTL